MTDYSERARRGHQTRRERGTSVRMPSDIEDEVVRLYRLGISASEIARRTFYDRSAVFSALRRRGVPIRPRGGVKGQVRTDDKLIGEAARLYQEGLRVVDVAERMGLTYGKVQRMIALHAGIPRRAQGRRGMTFTDPEELKKTGDLYLSGLSLRETAEAMGITKNAVWQRLDKLGIKRRPAAYNKEARSPERNRAAALKGWETRRAKRAGDV